MAIFGRCRTTAFRGHVQAVPVARARESSMHERSILLAGIAAATLLPFHGVAAAQFVDRSVLPIAPLPTTAGSGRVPHSAARRPRPIWDGWPAKAPATTGDLPYLDDMGGPRTQPLYPAGFGRRRWARHSSG